MAVAMRIAVALLFLALTAPAYAGDREEAELKVKFWQEHIRYLTVDFELSKIRLEVERVNLIKIIEAEQEATVNVPKEEETNDEE